MPARRNMPLFLYRPANIAGLLKSEFFNEPFYRYEALRKWYHQDAALQALMPESIDQP